MGLVDGTIGEEIAVLERALEGSVTVSRRATSFGIPPGTTSFGGLTGYDRQNCEESIILERQKQ